MSRAISSASSASTTVLAHGHLGTGYLPDELVDAVDR